MKKIILMFALLGVGFFLGNRGTQGAACNEGTFGNCQHLLTCQGSAWSVAKGSGYTTGSCGTDVSSGDPCDTAAVNNSSD